MAAVCFWRVSSCLLLLILFEWPASAGASGRFIHSVSRGVPISSLCAVQSRLNGSGLGWPQPLLWWAELLQRDSSELLLVLSAACLSSRLPSPC